MLITIKTLLRYAVKFSEFLKIGFIILYAIPKVMNWDIQQKLQDEHDFSFNKAKVPEKLIPLLNEIEDNKRKWKSLYVAVWGLSLQYLEPKFISKNRGGEIAFWVLPAFKLGAVQYKHNELNKYLTSYDHEIHISQLIKIFTLLENYFSEYYKIIKPKQKFIETILFSILNSRILRSVSKKFPKLRSRIDKQKFKYINPKLDLTKIWTLNKYLSENKLATRTEISELVFAKETRNSFIHRNGLVNGDWLKAYRNAGRKNPPKINEIIPFHLHDLENWTDIVINIVNKSLNTFSIG